jgi:hypothetical protein
MAHTCGRQSCPRRDRYRRDRGRALGSRKNGASNPGEQHATAERFRVESGWSGGQLVELELRADHGGGGHSPDKSAEPIAPSPYKSGEADGRTQSVAAPSAAARRSKPCRRATTRRGWGSGAGRGGRGASRAHSSATSGVGVRCFRLSGCRRSLSTGRRGAAGRLSTGRRRTTTKQWRTLPTLIVSAGVICSAGLFASIDSPRNTLFRRHLLVFHTSARGYQIASNAAGAICAPHSTLAEVAEATQADHRIRVSGTYKIGSTPKGIPPLLHIAGHRRRWAGCASSAAAVASPRWLVLAVPVRGGMMRPLWSRLSCW